MTARELYDTVLQDGVRLVLEGATLYMEGSDELLNKWRDVLRERKCELVAMIRQPDRLTQLREFCPRMWTPVHVKGGGYGLIWGVHARGVVVHVLKTNVLLTLDPEDVEIIGGTLDHG
jgi:hypothetical protein